MTNSEGGNTVAKRLISLLIGIAVFAILMVVRYEVDGVWVRAAIAGAALGILAWTFMQARRK